MKIIALIGPSGTGKSYNSIKVALRERLDAIIDDGLLIYNGKTITGYSAKLELNKMSAIKRAIFIDNAHAELIKEALTCYGIRKLINSLLILGTSKAMIEKITTRLNIPRAGQFIRVETIST